MQKLKKKEFKKIIDGTDVRNLDISCQRYFCLTKPEYFKTTPMFKGVNTNTSFYVVALCKKHYEELV